VFGLFPWVFGGEGQGEDVCGGGLEGFRGARRGAPLGALDLGK